MNHLQEAVTSGGTKSAEKKRPKAVKPNLRIQPPLFAPGRFEAAEFAGLSQNKLVLLSVVIQHTGFCTSRTS